MSAFTPEQEARIREIVRAELRATPPAPAYTPEARDAFLKGLGLNRDERRQELLQCFPDQVDVVDQLTPARDGASRGGQALAAPMPPAPAPTGAASTEWLASAVGEVISRRGPPPYA